jgi:hypothetical protein
VSANFLSAKLKCMWKMTHFFGYRLKFLLSLLWILLCGVLKFLFTMFGRSLVFCQFVMPVRLCTSAYLTLLPCLEKYPAESCFMIVDVSEELLSISSNDIE